jgi:glycosyltransferase involved in cell wall biosynthesis
VPKVLIVRGHLITPWELRPWQELPDRFDVSFLLTRSNGFDVRDLSLRQVPVRAVRDLLPKGPIGEIATGVIGDRYLGDAAAAYADADIVHAEELSFWFAADAARRRNGNRFKLALTIWETLPFLATYRNRHARTYRQTVLDATDLYLPATDRARDALLLEGVPEQRIVVCAPGIDVDRFQISPRGTPEEHVVISPGRLVWEKGHHDVMRAIAALHRGVVTRPDGKTVHPRLRIVGSGPEDRRLRGYAAELGIGEAVDFGSVPYERMPEVFAGASAMVLASLPSAGAFYHLFDAPHAFWEEQFGLVLAEAMASGLSIVTTTSGAIPEVVDRTAAALVAPGDWMAIARELASGPLSRAPGTRVDHGAENIQRYSTQAMAGRLAAAYDRLLAA